MRRSTRYAIPALAVALLTGCPPAEDPSPDPSAGPPATGSGDHEDASGDVCLAGEPFVAEGAMEVRDAEPGDADRVGALRWQGYEGCERLVIDLTDAGGVPASRTGAVDARVLRELGVVRIDLRGVDQGNHEMTDASFDGPLARAAYVIHEPEGRWVMVDVHLGDAAEAFVTTLDDPARVVVDLRPGGAAVPSPPPDARHVVVLEPRPGPSSYPLVVTGYARTFEANVVARIEQDGEPVFEDFTTSTGYLDAWGHFTFTIEDGPTGPVVLHVGEYSARDGTWEGARVDLVMARD